jgi:hypothetical protein
VSLQGDCCGIKTKVLIKKRRHSTRVKKAIEIQKKCRSPEHVVSLVTTIEDSVHQVEEFNILFVYSHG